MKKSSALATWCEQQQKQFDTLQQDKLKAAAEHRQHQERLTMLEQFSQQYSVSAGEAPSALLLKGMGHFRAQLDVMKAMQKQEVTMAEIELRSVDERLLAQHCRLEGTKRLMSKRAHKVKQQLERKQQAVMDELAANRFVQQQKRNG